MQESPSSPDRVEEYIQLITTAEPMLRVYIISMIPIVADAEDILQDTKICVWKDFSKYESGTHFGAWARRIAYHRILAFRKKKAIENKKIVFSEEFYEVVDRHTEIDESYLAERTQKLMSCINQLQAEHKKAVVLKYQKGLSIEEVSQKIQRTVAATYRLVSRVRMALKDCVRMQEKMI
jgi:RNA polymerase sigma-70 factor (ECF subfamily)